MLTAHEPGSTCLLHEKGPLKSLFPSSPGTNSIDGRGVAEGLTLPAAALSQARALLSELLLAVLEAEKQRHPAQRPWIIHKDPALCRLLQPNGPLPPDPNQMAIASIA
jgi:hypothetical protein